MVAEIMDFNHIKHTPVENEEGDLIGLVSARNLLRYFAHRFKNGAIDGGLVSDIMITEPITITPEASISEAISSFRENKISCLPVVNGKKLVGVITEEDFLSIARRLIKEIDQPDRSD